MNSLIYKCILKRKDFRYKYLCYRRNVTSRSMLKALWLWYIKRNRGTYRSFSEFVLRTVGRIPVSTDCSVCDKTMSAVHGRRLADSISATTEKYLGTDYEVVKQPGSPRYLGYDFLYDTFFRRRLTPPEPNGPHLESGISRSCLPLVRVTYLGTKSQPGMTEIYERLKRDFRAVCVGEDIFVVSRADDDYLF